MIGFLRGIIVDKRDQAITVDVNGVGYEVFISDSIQNQNLSLGSEIKLIVYTDVRETAIVLYGFNNILEREVFLLVKKVKGVGPKLAMNIVSALGADIVLAAIGRHDISVFQKVSGVGKKTAARLLVELGEQVGDYIPTGVIPSSQKSAPLATPNSDAILALEKLGFPETLAKGAVANVLDSFDGKPASLSSSELLRMALAQL